MGITLHQEPDKSGRQTFARQAFTLPEMMIVVLILSSMMVVVGNSIVSGNNMDLRMAVENALSDNANRVLGNLAFELRNADWNPTGLLVGPSATSPVTPPSSYNSADWIYQFRTTDGITYSGTTFGAQVEAGYHWLVYDPTAGTLSESDFDGSGNLLWTTMICMDLAPISASLPRGGFYLDQVGNTLAMELVLTRSLNLSFTSDSESFVQKSDSQVLFLRSTLDTNLGSSPYSSSDTAFVGDNTANASPSLFYGHLITLIAGGNSEMTVFAQPFIGQTLDLTTLSVQAWSYTNGVANAAVTFTPGVSTPSPGLRPA